MKLMQKHEKNDSAVRQIFILKVLTRKIYSILYSVPYLNKIIKLTLHFDSKVIHSTVSFINSRFVVAPYSISTGSNFKNKIQHQSHRKYCMKKYI